MSNLQDSLSRICLNWIRIVLTGGFLLITHATVADIAAFNQAIKQGDYKGAAKETTEIWSTFDKKSKQTAIIAREFGFVNYVARDFDNAEMFAKFLVDKGAELSVPDDQPATSRVLLDLTRFSIKQGERERRRLADAIEKRLETEGVDQISLLAAKTLYRGDWIGGQWPKVSESTALAVALYQRAGKNFLKEQRDAEVIAAAAAFLGKPAFKDYDQMVSVHNQIVQDINESSDAKIASELLGSKWTAQAWVNTMEAFFQSSHSQLGTLIDSSLTYQDLTVLNDDVLAGDNSSESKPVCPGKVDVGKLSYPLLWAERRLVGSVIMNLSFDEQGKVSNSEVLAEAPPNLFVDSVKEAIPTFSWEVNPGVNQSLCRLNQSNYVHVIGFWGNCAATYTRGDCPRTALESGSPSRSTADFSSQ